MSENVAFWMEMTSPLFLKLPRLKRDPHLVSMMEKKLCSSDGLWESSKMTCWSRFAVKRRRKIKCLKCKIFRENDRHSILHRIVQKSVFEKWAKTWQKIDIRVILQPIVGFWNLAFCVKFTSRFFLKLLWLKWVFSFHSNGLCGSNGSWEPPKMAMPLLVKVCRQTGKSLKFRIFWTKFPSRPEINWTFCWVAHLQ